MTGATAHPQEAGGFSDMTADETAGMRNRRTAKQKDARAGGPLAGSGNHGGADHDRHDSGGEHGGRECIQGPGVAQAAVMGNSTHDGGRERDGERQVGPEDQAPAGQVGDDPADDKAAGAGDQQWCNPHCGTPARSQRHAERNAGRPSRPNA